MTNSKKGSIITSGIKLIILVSLSTERDRGTEHLWDIKLWLSETGKITFYMGKLSKSLAIKILMKVNILMVDKMVLEDLSGLRKTVIMKGTGQME